MSESASGSSKASRAADVVSLLVGLFVAAMVGHTVMVEQRAALEQCAPSCDLRRLIVAQADAIVTWPVALARVTVGPVPVGAAAIVIVCLFLLRYVRVGPTVR